MVRVAGRDAAPAPLRRQRRRAYPHCGSNPGPAASSEPVQRSSSRVWAGALFFLSFLVVRAVYFPYVMFAHLWADALAVYSLPLDERRGLSDVALFAFPLTGAAFSVLQWHWAILLTKQVIKVYGGAAKKKA